MVPLIPREVLFGNPQRISAALSPDGTRLAYLAPDDGVLNIWVRTLGQDDDRVVTRDRGRGIRAYRWAPDGTRLLYVQDRDGDENWHVYAVPVGGGEERDLTPVDGVQAQIVATRLEHPDTALIAMNDRNPQLHDVYRVNLSTGKRELEAENTLGAVGWLADHDLRVRLAQVPTPEAGYALFQRAGDGDAWRETLRWDAEDAFSTEVLAFAEEPHQVYLASSIGHDTARPVRLDLRTGDMTKLAEGPARADVSELLTHPTTHRAQAVAFYAERKRWTVLDSEVEEDFKALSALPGGDLSILSRDRADRTWLVAVIQDRGPVLYYAYHRADRRTEFLFSHRPELENLSLAPMQPVSYSARDGLEIPAYLTLPVEVEPRNLPVVINVHGGPWVRDTWGYDPESQWFANRGYATLQINYRGSTGYGKAHTNAADREWGGKMQDDVTDGVRWLVEQGIAHPKRVAIFGGSYGGYAVLSGLVKDPGLYACGVDLVGVSNLITWLNTIPPYWKPLEPMLWRRVGHPEKDREFLESRSPYFHVDKIQAPLLIAQGANDPRVPREESLQIVEALKQAGKDVKYVEYEDEGHGFARPENRLEFYALAEEFLARHLGGRFEPA